MVEPQIYNKPKMERVKPKPKFISDEEVDKEINTVDEGVTNMSQKEMAKLTEGRANKTIKNEFKNENPISEKIVKPAKVIVPVITSKNVFMEDRVLLYEWIDKDIEKLEAFLKKRTDDTLFKMVFYMPINEIQFKMLVNMQQRFKARLIPSGKARVIRAVK